MTAPARRPQVPAHAFALNILAGLWLVLGVAAGVSLWPSETRVPSTGQTLIAGDKGQAVLAMLLAGTAATVALAGAAVVVQVAKRGGEV